MRLILGENLKRSTHLAPSYERMDLLVEATMNLSKRSLGMLWLSLFMGCYATAQQQSVERDGRFVRATGNAESALKPDQVEFQIGVVTEAATAKEAAAANAANSSRVLEQLKKAVGPNGEVRTTSYTVYPRYRHDQGKRERQLVGFTATNSVLVELNQIEKVSELIDLATQAGANQIHGIQFTLRDKQVARAQALQQAAKKALANAEAIATAVGAKLGRVRSVKEEGSSPIEPLRTMALAESRTASTPIEPGSINIAASVTITVELE